MSALLIDDRGKFWDARSLVLRLKLHTTIAPAELCEFAILNMGFIGLVRSGDRVRVRLRPALVTQTALAALYFWLHEHVQKRVALAWHNGCWQDEIIGWNRHGRRRIASLLEGMEPDRQRFSRTKINLDALGSKNSLRDLINHWTASPTALENSREMLQERLNNRFILLEEDIDHELRVRDFGRGMMSRAPSWRDNAIGLRVEDLPDWKYGQWVAEAYREVARSGQPLIERVAAVIQWPECGEVSHSYWRAILPHTKPGAPTRLLGVTLDRADRGVHNVA